jgi:5-methylcytosine-specific restriction endonuclease McrBC GTP-binding regulatory subunit McrB
MDNTKLAGKTRDIIRLWNSMRMLEREGATARLFVLRTQLQQALAERDRLIEETRHYAKAS